MKRAPAAITSLSAACRCASRPPSDPSVKSPRNWNPVRNDRVLPHLESIHFVPYSGIGPALVRNPRLRSQNGDRSERQRLIELSQQAARTTAFVTLTVTVFFVYHSNLPSRLPSWLSFHKILKLLS